MIIYNKEKICLDIIIVINNFILIKYENIEKYRMIEKERSNYTIYKIIYNIFIINLKLYIF